VLRTPYFRPIGLALADPTNQAVEGGLNRPSVGVPLGVGGLGYRSSRRRGPEPPPHPLATSATPASISSTPAILCPVNGRTAKPTRP